MIENPLPDHWRQLQDGVCRLFCEIGLNAETEVSLGTPRGAVTVDVHAIDEASVDQITYLVECKNWNDPIPQHVVHSFTTVMHETGGNIGFVVSKYGLQAGAVRYIENTNIEGLTYELLQARYLRVWWQRWFYPNVAGAADSVLQYVEPINSRRTRFLERLDRKKQERYEGLRQRFQTCGLLMWMMDVGTVMPKHASDPPPSAEGLNARLVAELGDEFQFEAAYFRPLMEEICTKLKAIEERFNEIFGRNIFENET